MSKTPTLKAVKAAHAKYVEAQARWGENNQQAMNACAAYWELRTAYEAAGKTYTA